MLLAAILLAGLALPGCSRRSAGGKKNDAAPFLAGSAEEPVIPPEFDNYVQAEDLIEWDYSEPTSMYSMFAPFTYYDFRVNKRYEDVQVKWMAACGGITSENGAEAQWFSGMPTSAHYLTVIGYDPYTMEITVLQKKAAVSSMVNGVVEMAEDDPDGEGKALEVDGEIVMKNSFTVEPNEDYDEDGLDNQSEERYGTDLWSDDTDNDSLSDHDEIFVYSTDPLSADTDGDGVADGYETAAGTDPLKKSTDGKTPDSDRRISHTFTAADGGFSLELTGSINQVAGAYFNVYENDYLAGFKGVVSPVIDISTDDNGFDSAVLEYRFQESDLINKDPKSISFAYINETDNTVELIPTEVDPTSGTARATLQHFSKYVLVQIGNIVNSFSDADIVFVIDQSGSMQDNDPHDKRLDAAKDLLASFGEGIKTAFVQFSYGAEIVVGDFSEYNENYENEINRLYYDAYGGTNIGEGLESALELLSDRNGNSIIILFTDGEDSNTSYIASQVSKAVERHVRIYVIGLGYAVNESMLRGMIAEPTGGLYYHIDMDQQIDMAFESLGKKFAAKHTDETDETVLTGSLIADSGFDIAYHAYAFENFVTKNASGGNCQGMAMTAKLNYVGKLASSKKSEFLGKTAYDISSVDAFRTKNLYSLNISDRALYIGEIYNSSMKYRILQDGVYKFDPFVRRELEKFGYTIETQKKFKLDKKDVKKKCEFASLDLHSEEFASSSYWNTDGRGEALKCIYWWFQNQTDLIEKFDNILFKTGNLTKKNQFDKMVNAIKKGEPVVLGISGEYLHALVAERVLRSADNPHSYYVLVYDCNHPGEDRFFTVTEKTLFGFVTGYKISFPDYYKYYDIASIYYYTPE